MKSSNKSDGRGATTRPLKSIGTLPQMSAMVGGISNRTVNPSAKKGAATYNTGGAVQGGFRNAGMANKR